MAHDVLDVDRSHDGPDDRLVCESSSVGTTTTAEAVAERDPASSSSAIDALRLPDLTSPPLTILGHEIHPAANNFRLMTEHEFIGLRDAVRQAKRVVIPIELYDGKVIDGRNRGLAVETLLEAGIEVVYEFVTWTPTGDETVMDRVIANNAHRRRETPDEMAAAACKFLPEIREQAQQRQRQSRFTRTNNPRVRTAANRNASPSKRDSKRKNDNSTAGMLSAKFGISLHWARLAIALADAVTDGKVTPSTLDDVLYGRCTLKAALPPKPRRPKQGPADVDSRSNPSVPPSPATRRGEGASAPINPANLWGKPPLASRSASEGGEDQMRSADGTDANPSPEDAEKAPVSSAAATDLRESVLKDWAKFCKKYPIADLPVVRGIVKDAIEDADRPAPRRRKGNK